eukprot:353300-Chlamydomonas_euryale.AAC.2
MNESSRIHPFSGLVSSSMEKNCEKPQSLSFEVNRWSDSASAAHTHALFVVRSKQNVAAECVQSEAACVQSEAACVQSQAACVQSQAACVQSEAACVQSQACRHPPPHNAGGICVHSRSPLRHPPGALRGFEVQGGCQARDAIPKPSTLNFRGEGLVSCLPRKLDAPLQA